MNFWKQFGESRYQGLFRSYLKTFVAPFLPTRLTVPGSPRMRPSLLDGNVDTDLLIHQAHCVNQIIISMKINFDIFEGTVLNLIQFKIEKMNRFLESSLKNHSFSFKKNYGKTFSLKPVTKPVRVQFKM